MTELDFSYKIIEYIKTDIVGRINHIVAWPLKEQVHSVWNESTFIVGDQ